MREISVESHNLMSWFPWFVHAEPPEIPARCIEPLDTQRERGRERDTKTIPELEK